MDLVDKIRDYLQVGQTVRVTTLMRKFHSTRDEVEDAVEDLRSTYGGYDLIVGGQISGAGYWTNKRSDHEVERYQ